MTDLADPLTEELTSPNEVVPREAAHEAPPLVGGRSCPECGTTTTKAGLPFITDRQVAVHRAKVHGVHTTTPRRTSTQTSSQSSPRRTRAAKPASRQSVATLLGRIAEGAASVLANVSPAGARSMTFAAPAIGQAADELIAGTRVDKLAQRVVVSSDRWERVVSALSLPVLVTLCELNPILISQLEGPMREALTTILITSLPAIKKKREREREVTLALAELGQIAPALADLDDPIGAILSGFFASDVPEEPTDGAGPA